MQRFESRARGGTDGANARAQRPQVGGGLVQALQKESHAIGAGKDQPIVRAEVGDGAIQRLVIERRKDFDGGQFDRLGAQRAQFRGERFRLAAGARHHDALSE